MSEKWSLKIKMSVENQYRTTLHDKINWLNYIQQVLKFEPLLERDIH